MVRHLRITYTPRSDATPETERGALTSVYAFILRCHEEKRDAGESGRYSAKGDMDDRAKASIP